MEHAATSPGSRCTPVVLSLVRQPRIRCWSHVDERSAAFFALGAAKGSGRPVAVVCTSGTAAANLAPAVIEAYQARVPLIVLTADRPAELRDVGAGQTIDQMKLYGGAVNWFVEADLGRADPERMRWIRHTACRAYWTSVSGRPGPVHLNLPLREPLVMDEPLPDDPVPGRPEGRPWLRPLPAHGSRTTPDLPLPSRTAVVAGRHERRDGLGAALAALAEKRGFPLLADPLSGARLGDALIVRYDLLLRFESFTTSVRPELILRAGDLPTSKPLRAWLASLSDVEQLTLDPEQAWQDPSGVVSEFTREEPLAVIKRAAGSSVERDERWLSTWRAADQAADGAIQEILGDELSEPAVAAGLTQWLPPEATLFVASSMPIRDVEEFGARGPGLPRVLANRGANGIDGTIASSFGVAATGAPVVLLIGDVAAAHDIGSLLSARRLGLPLTIVVINNDGGGIFHFLRVAEERDAFEDHVATPHGLDFRIAAELYGCRHELVQSLPELRNSVLASLDSAGTSILEVGTTRSENLVLHRRVADAVGRALSI
jgi:2-succinyl-5-enolpyruvyl-6-hydroxy-3-cyclohexene-1-carboxylate synthase